MVGPAIGRGRRPGRLDQLADAEARRRGSSSLNAATSASDGVAAGRNRVLPDQVFRRDFRPEVADLGAHVAMGELEPGAGEGVLERLMVVAELLRDRAELGVHLQRHVGRGHHRRHALATDRARPGAMSSALLVDRLPLLGAGRASAPAHIHSRAAGGNNSPTIRSGVFTHAPSMPLVMVCSPKPLSWALAQPRPCSAMSAASGAASTRLGVARAMRLAEGVAAGGERDRLLMVHRHALERDLDVARRLQRIGDCRPGLPD